MSSNELVSMKLVDLKSALSKRGLPTSGNKPELVKRFKKTLGVETKNFGRDISTMNMKELKGQLKNRTLPVTGNKKDLILRLLQNKSTSKKRKAPGKSENGPSPNKKGKIDQSRSKKNFSPSVSPSGLPQVPNGIKAPEVTVYKCDDSSQPKFSPNFEIVRQVVLMGLDKSEADPKKKYYSLEIHKGGDNCRLFTHYGKLDLLETNSRAGFKQCRYYKTEGSCNAAFMKIHRQKTKKGFAPVKKYNHNIGSDKAKHPTNIPNGVKKNVSKRPVEEKYGEDLSMVAVLDLVARIYQESMSFLTARTGISFTEDGLQTPQGLITLEYIDSAETILLRLYDLFKSNGPHDEVTRLTNDFYAAIPQPPNNYIYPSSLQMIDSLSKFSEFEELLQLMRDLLTIHSRKSTYGSEVLTGSDIELKLKALDIEIDCLKPNSKTYKDLLSEMRESQLRSHGVEVIKPLRIFKIKRKQERLRFDKAVPNQKLLYHGAKAQNWVGILSRGILIPSIISGMGGNRTGGGLGDGIYFGECDTAGNYAKAGCNGTAFMAIVRVGLGKIKSYSKISYGLSCPKGYNSTHGSPRVASTQFYDNEYVIYDQKQSQMEYLVEFTD